LQAAKLSATAHVCLPAPACRETDLPEREQLHRGPDPAAFDLPACAAWIWGQLLGEQRTAGGRVRTLLEDGVREVEGTPPAWYGYPTWSDYDLKGKIRELGSHRALFVRRENRPKEQQEWLANEGAQEELRRCIQTVLSHVYDKHEEVRGWAAAFALLLDQLARCRACWSG
jgi:hypothetical protein